MERSAQRVEKFDASGTFLTAWGRERAAGEFANPSGVATDGSGNVYVADTYNHRIHKFDASGTFLAMWGRYGSDNGQFNCPAVVATDGGGNVYVADGGNHRSPTVDADRTFLTSC